MTPVHCAHCGETRRTWSLWQQIINLGKPVVCCWAQGVVNVE